MELLEAHGQTVPTNRSLMSCSFDSHCWLKPTASPAFVQSQKLTFWYHRPWDPPFFLFGQYIKNEAAPKTDRHDTSCKTPAPLQMEPSKVLSTLGLYSAPYRLYMPPVGHISSDVSMSNHANNMQYIDILLDVGKSLSQYIHTQKT